MTDKKAKSTNQLFFSITCNSKVCQGGFEISKLRVALIILGDAMLFISVALLLQLDKLINSTLYDYGLIFSNDWAQPYWLILRICLVLIVAAVFLISIVELPYPAFQEKA